jgi:pimeloyl-ACP methyl ester carboxylesterase
MSTCGLFDSDNERIYFECWGDATETVILGHGLGGSHAVWYQQVASLVPRYRVVTWDQRGFGRSTAVSGDIGPVPAVRDLERLLDHLAIARAHVVGQSMGGWSALGFAIEHPERVLSLVLADTTAGIFTPQILQALTNYGLEMSKEPPVDQLPLGHHPAIGSQMLHEDLAQSFLYTQLGSLTDPPSPASIFPLLLSNDHTDRTAEVKTPTLFMVGEFGPIVPPLLVDAAARFIEGSEVAGVENTGHSPYFERPALWNAIVADFLQESIS